MDELKLKLSTKIMRGIIAKLLSKLISKKVGCKVYIQLNELEAETRDGRVHFHANVDAQVNTDDLAKIIENVNLD